VATRARGTNISLVRSSGGLATGLGAYHDASDALWIGWPGQLPDAARGQLDDLDARLRRQRIVPVHLSSGVVDRYYHGFANRVLWPVCHYLVDQVPVDATGWDAYQSANRTFADAVAREYQEGDAIWVNDYQLMLVPALVRERLPDARIGYFLHIPFPSSEVFRVLPWRRQLLEGLLGADFIGFHTFSYMRHFLSALHHIDDIEADIDRLHVGKRLVTVGVVPMGVDAAQFSALARSDEVTARAEAIRRDAGGRRIVLGVDRLDYTKGIPRRLQAIERLLASNPDAADRIRYVQVAVPSRGEVDSYQRFKRQLEETIGRINGARGTVASTPVHYIHRSIPLTELVALYLAADIMLVTPLRDGMNLVAKEFVASRVDDDGVLVLSEFAGAAAELDGAVIINPYDVEAVAQTLQRALSMPREERRTRMVGLRSRVELHDVHAWVRVFLDRLVEADAPGPAAAKTEPQLLAAIAEARRREGLRLRLLLDYDGTLVPLERSPELARPDEELLSLLRSLAQARGMRVDVVSGRGSDVLEQWFGELPLALWAEHGLWHRSDPGVAWQRTSDALPDLMARLTPILEQFVASTPGSHVEVKSASMAWHYRRAEREFGTRQARELRLLLTELLRNQPFEMLQGKRVVEVRARGVSKALVARAVRLESDPLTLVVAVGDDRTDEELFRALPASSITVAVGARPSRARFHLEDYQAVRRLLRALLAGSPPQQDRTEASR
jgi:trehalose 6-phosphate synthase/phosphatase